MDTNARYRFYNLPLVLAGLTVCFGSLPFFQFVIYSHRHYNVVWDSVYGFGFVLCQFLLGKEGLDRPLAAFGMFIWPILIFSLIACFFYKLLKSNCPRLLKTIIFILFFTTLAFNITINYADLVEHHRWYPFYSVYMDGEYP